MSKVQMYSTGYCPYCTRAEMLLKQRGVTEIEKIRIDVEPGRRGHLCDPVSHEAGTDDADPLDLCHRPRTVCRASAR